MQKATSHQLFVETCDLGILIPCLLKATGNMGRVHSCGQRENSQDSHVLIDKQGETISRRIPVTELTTGYGSRKAGNITRWNSTNMQGSEFKANTKTKVEMLQCFSSPKNWGLLIDLCRLKSQVVGSQSMNMCHNVVLELYLEGNSGPLEGLKTRGCSVSDIIISLLKDRSR